MSKREDTNRLSSYGRLGILLGFIGIVLAIDTMADLTFLYKLWPLLVTTLGIGFIGIYKRRSRKEGIYVGAGIYLVGFSFLALYCSLTSWHHMANLWPTFIGLLGITFILGFILGTHGRTLLLFGSLLLSLSIVFFFVFEISGRLWWSIFILAGISFLLFDRTKPEAAYGS